MTGSTSRKAPSPVVIALTAVLFVLVPLLTWQQTWFGRKLSDAQEERYLQDNQHPRRIQHALSQLSDRILRGDSTARKFYPRVTTLAHHPASPIRVMAAWVFGQDSSSALFHQTLLDLLHDPEPMVRRNAALSLVRFQDASGRPELLEMLGACQLRSPVAGRVTLPVAPRESVGAGKLLARVIPDEGGPVEIRSPFPGEVAGVLARDGSRIDREQPLVSIYSEADQVFEALRGLYLIGRAEDLGAVEHYAVVSAPDLVRRQAELTARAIRARWEPNPNR
ncbi:MAG TPA: HEAT repeat domain-containing protein [Anaerolineales bacterium]